MEAEDTADTGASGSGAHPAKVPESNPAGAKSQAAAPMEPAEEDEPYTREEAITAFIGAPNLPAADQLVMGHISAFMALASISEGPTHKQAVKLLSMKYDLATATQI